MVEPNEGAVLKLAKALAERDGFTWELDFGVPGAFGAPLRRQHFLSKEGQQEYLRHRRATHMEAGAGRTITAAWRPARAGYARLHRSRRPAPFAYADQ